MIGKRALRKTLRSQCLTEKQLVTILTEAVVNSRPLVYVDDDINSSMILTHTIKFSVVPFTTHLSQCIG